MKQNITVAVEKQLLQRIEALAAQRKISISAMIESELKRIVVNDSDFESFRIKALAQLNSPFRLGGGTRASRESLHRRPHRN